MGAICILGVLVEGTANGVRQFRANEASMGVIFRPCSVVAGGGSASE